MPVTLVRHSLQTLAGGYSVFEQDQVLTAVQLNTLSEYAEDQTRLTRVRLLGVGVVCGLRPSVAGGKVRVTRGVGVTTDGDLLALDADTVYDRWLPYDASRPRYFKLYPGGDVSQPMIPTFELVKEGANAPGAQPLGTLPAAAGTDFAGLTAVLLMESYIRDEDLCSGTDCDNLGRDALHTPRLLVLKSGPAGGLKETIATPDAAFAQLPYVVAERPAIPVGLNSMTTLATLYRSACATTHTRLVDALGKIYPALGAFLGDYFAANPAQGWVSRLASIQTQFATTTTGIQYYYDFLRDVTDTYNEFRDHVFGDATLCAPDLMAFPKHLLLGDLVPGADVMAHRTGFYPSPLTGRAAGEVDHAAFLLKKLDAQLNRFQLPTGSTVAIRVTPSMGEDRPLEERAIPFYYQPGTPDPIHRRWSYRLTRRRMEAHNYSYHAAAYGAQGGAANPLGSQIGRFSFFRVEGHLGRPVASALAEIEGMIRSYNLPFTVRAVLLGADRAKIVIRPPRRYSPIKRLHGVLRKDLAYQLDDVTTFSDKLMLRSTGEVKARVASREDPDRVTISEATSGYGDTVKYHAVKARAALDVGYDDYRAEPAAWVGDLRGTMENSALLMTEIGHVTRPEFVSPYDSLIASPASMWLPWIDDLIEHEEKEEDERLLFSKFAGEHPQVEHFGGVPRGGTLVLAYDQSNTVVADFMLPYHVHDEPEQEEPALKPRPPIRPPVVIDRPIKFVPSREDFFEDQWQNRLPDILPDIKGVGAFIDEQTVRIDDLIHTYEEQIGVLDKDIKAQITDRIDRELASLTATIDIKMAGQEKILDARVAGQDRVLETVQASYMTVLSDSLNVIKSTSSTYTTPKGYADQALGAMVQESAALEDKLGALEAAASRPDVDAKTKSFLQSEITRTQGSLAEATEKLAGYLAATDASVVSGSEGQRAVQQAGRNMSRLAGTDVHKQVQTNLGGIAANVRNTSLQGAINNLSKF